MNQTSTGRTPHRYCDPSVPANDLSAAEHAQRLAYISQVIPPTSRSINLSLKAGKTVIAKDINLQWRQISAYRRLTIFSGDERGNKPRYWYQALDRRTGDWFQAFDAITQVAFDAIREPR